MRLRGEDDSVKGFEFRVLDLRVRVQGRRSCNQ